MNFSSTLGALRITGLLEGCSYLALAFTMLLKYQYGMGLPNKIVGYAHGLLFIVYILLVFLVGMEKKWSVSTKFWAYVASILPFGTFVADARIFKKSAGR